MPPRRHGLTNSEFAAKMGVTLQTVTGWERKGWIVRFGGDDRSIDPDASAAEVDRKRDRKSVSRGKADKLTASLPPEGQESAYPVPKGVTLDDARTRKEHWLAVRAELDAQERKGELLPAADVLRAWQAVLANLRANLRNLPSRLAADMHGLDLVAAEAVALAAIDELLAQLSDNPPEVKS